MILMRSSTIQTPSSPRDETFKKLKASNPDLVIFRVDLFRPESYVEEVEKLARILEKDEESRGYIGFYQGVLNQIPQKTHTVPDDRGPPVSFEPSGESCIPPNGLGFLSVQPPPPAFSASTPPPGCFRRFPGLSLRRMPHNAGPWRRFYICGHRRRAGSLFPGRPPGSAAAHGGPFSPAAGRSPLCWTTPAPCRTAPPAFRSLPAFRCRRSASFPPPAPPPFCSGRVPRRFRFSGFGRFRFFRRSFFGLYPRRGV